MKTFRISLISLAILLTLCCSAEEISGAAGRYIAAYPTDDRYCELSINEDCTFSGISIIYDTDTEVPGYSCGTAEACTFTGTLTPAEQNTGDVLSYTLTGIEVSALPDDMRIEGIPYTVPEEFELSDGEILSIYIPGTEMASLPGDMLFYDLYDMESENLDTYALYIEDIYTAYIRADE